MRRYLLTPLLLALLVPALHAANTTDTPKAAATRKKLQKPVTVEYKDALLRDVLDDLKDQADVTFLPDTKGGVNLNSKITYKAKNKPLEEVLNGICDKADLGYFIISNKANGYDGSFRITRGKERGYEAGKEPDKTAAAPKEKPDKTPKPDKTAKTVPEPKEKPEATEKTEKPSSPEDDAEEMEKIAGRRLKLAKEILDDGKAEKAQSILQDLVKKYPKTKAAEEAKKLLAKDSDTDK